MLNYIGSGWCVPFLERFEHFLLLSSHVGIQHHHALICSPTDCNQFSGAHFKLFKLLCVTPVLPIEFLIFFQYKAQLVGLGIMLMKLQNFVLVILSVRYIIFCLIKIYFEISHNFFNPNLICF
jgi:hypothetical protein